MRPEVVNLLPVAVYVAIGSQSCPWRADALPVAVYVRPEVVNLLPVAVYVAIGGQSCPLRADALPVAVYVRPEVGVYPPFDLLRWSDI